MTDSHFSLVFATFYFLFQSEGEDELKKRQLMELAIINGTYRDSQSKIAGSRKLNKASSFSFPSKDENTARVEITNCINKLLEFVLSSQ
jgi:hypothetical protein